jgi:uncharacterized membrane protein YheB (UPF0754 family)
VPSPILARADALMHRKRQTEADIEDVPLLTDAIDDEDDIPVLVAEAPSAPAEKPLPATTDPANSQTVATETLGAEEVLTVAIAIEQTQPESASAPTPSATELREQLASELARRVEQRLAAELPRIIESTLRDFLAEQTMIAASSQRD